MKIFENYAILEGEAPALVIELGSNVGITTDANADNSIDVNLKGSKKTMEFYPWGEQNDFPDKILKLSYKNNVVASNLDFNARIGYGDVVMPVRKVVGEDGQIKHIPVTAVEYPEIFSFLEDNNYSLIQQELAHDLTVLQNGFVEFIFNKPKTRILQIRFKEAAFSRLSVMNDDGQIEFHGYSAKWTEDTDRDDVVATPLLDYDNPLYDLKARLGQVPGPDGKKKKDNTNSRYVLHIGQPSPGKFYYQKAYWWSIFESHWFDFACAVPEFKMNLMKNQMVLKYHVEIRKNYFSDLFKSEGITNPEKQAARKKEFYQDLEDFLSGKENAGKNFVSEVDYGSAGKATENHDFKIIPIESFIKGGEYIEDSEEASNAICYAMGVHPSLQGASPGKNKTINGTEARELFTIKQSLMKPVRDLLVQPLRIVKAINKWPVDIDFVIPNILLTTLDKNTGAEKQIGSPKF